MDYIGCDMNHLDVDVRLPPRKRFLAGLKRQSCSESSSLSSQENNPSPSLTGSVENVSSPDLTGVTENILSPSLCPSIDQLTLSEFDDRLKNLLKSYKNGCNMSPEEIILAAKSAADVAEKAAKAARAAAEEKAAIAAKAVAAAKSALRVVASQRSSRHNKNKLNRHGPVKLMYNKFQPFEEIGEDEELAKKLHRAMNSSPRISKHPPGSELKNNKCKKLKIYLPSDEIGVCNVTSMRDGNVRFPDGNVVGGIDSKGSNKKISYTVKVDEKVEKVQTFCENDEVKVDSDDGESSYAKKSFEGFDGLCINGRFWKRGRITQKKLPLSMCSSKDQENPKEELNLTNSSRTRVRIDNVTPMEVTPAWKCQDFKVSQCI